MKTFPSSFLLLLLTPCLAFANSSNSSSSPSMMTLTLELGLMAFLIIFLLKAEFSIEKKGLIFVAYVVLGVLTKTIWFPVLVAAALYVFFVKNDSGDTGDS